MEFNEIGIDGDIILYSVGFATQRNIYILSEAGQQDRPVLTSTDKRLVNKYIDLMDDYHLETYTYVQAPLSAYITADSIIRSYKEKYKTDNIKVFLTGKTNFRLDVATILPYKGNRDDEKPHNYAKLKQYLIKKHKAIVVEGEEADDALSKMLVRNPKALLVSDDKDLLNTAGWHLRPRKGDKPFYVSPEEADKNFYKQLLTGDKSVDNIPGLKGIGPAKAEKLLADCTTVEEMECVIGNLYAKYYNDPEAAMIEVGRLLWMRRQDNEMWYPKCLGGCKYVV
jgi:hypothetical protein